MSFLQKELSSSGVMARWPWHSALGILAIFATCFLLDSDTLQVSSAAGLICDARPGQLLFRTLFEEGEHCGATSDAAVVEATLSTGSGKRARKTQGNPEPTTISHLDPTRIASESTYGDASCPSSTFPPSLVSHGAEIRRSKADEEARGSLARHRGVPSFLGSVVEPPGEERRQAVAAEGSITSLGETGTVMIKTAVGGIGIEVEVGGQGSWVDGRLTEIGTRGKAPSQELGSEQEPLPGAVETFESTASEMLEASSSHDLVTCDVHQEGDPDGGASVTSSDGVESAVLELPLEDHDAVELETGLREQATHSYSRSLSRPIVDPHFPVKAMVETGAEERGAGLFEGKNTLGIDTDARGAVETIEAVSEIQEASASRDIDICDVRQGGDPDAGKDHSSSRDGGANTTPEPPLWSDDAVELETGPRKQDLQSYSGGLPRPIRDSFLFPAAVVEAGTQDRKGRLDGTNTLFVDTNARVDLETIGFTVTETLEASASRNIVSCDAQQKGHPDAGKGFTSNSGGGESAALELPVEGDHVVELKTAQGLHSFSESLSRPIRDPYLSPAVELDPGAQEREATIVESDESNILGVEVNAGGAVEGMEFTVSEIPEASASHDIVTCDAHQEGDPDAGKDHSSSSIGEVESAPPQPPLKSDDAIELVTGPGEQGVFSNSGSISCPMRDPDHFPISVFEAGAQKRRAMVMKRDESNVLGVDTDAGGAVEAIEFTVTETSEASASRDIVTFDVPQEEDADAGKDVSSSAGGEIAALEPQLEGDDAVEPGTGPRKNGVHSSSESLSNHFPTAELEAGAEEQGSTVVKGNKSNILGIDTDAGGAVETTEFTVTETLEASASRDIVTCDAHQEELPDAGKNISSSGAGGENMALESPTGDNDAIDLETGPRKQRVLSHSQGISCPMLDPSLYPEAVFEAGTEERRGPLVKGEGRNILGVDMDVGDGDDVAREPSVEDEMVEKVSSDTTLSSWWQWACTTLLCVILVASYAYAQGKLPRWLLFNGGDPYEGWARDLDSAIATARSRTGSLCSASGRSSVVDDLALPDLVSEDEPFPLSDEIQGDGASDRPRIRECGTGKQEDEGAVLMWDTRPKPPDHLVFDPVLGIVPRGILDAWACAERESVDGGSGSKGDVAKNAADPDGLARGSCCGNWTPLERREKKKRALPPVRYTPEWHAWRAARADSVLAESPRAESVRAESVDLADTESEKGPKEFCPHRGEDEVVEGAAAVEATVAAAAVALGKKGNSLLPKIWTPSAIDSQFEGVMDGARGIAERSGGCGEDDGGKFVEFSSEIRDDDDNDARRTERCSAPVSTTSPEASPAPPAVQTCL